jgi:site-specific DNA-methyltransferase (adenine-specific)
MPFFMPDTIGPVTLYHGDCLEQMAHIPDGSVDMVLCDLPYGTTACTWDSVIPLGTLWAHYRRIIKPRGVIALTGSQPFTTTLIASNVEWFKYEWVWEKTRATGHVHAKNKPLKAHENILIFSPGTTVHASQSMRRMAYNPQGIIEVNRTSYRPSRGVRGSDVVCALRKSHKKEVAQPFTNYPRSVLRIASEHNVGALALHPTQKPVALFAYLIRTYSNPGDLVLDNCLGSGTTAVACIQEVRRCIGIERDEAYYAIARQRIAAAHDALEHTFYVQVS